MAPSSASPLSPYCEMRLLPPTMLLKPPSLGPADSRQAPHPPGSRDAGVSLSLGTWGKESILKGEPAVSKAKGVPAGH